MSKRERRRREQYEPLHTALMEFTAAFYLKSLSDNNQQDQIGREVDSLCENGSDSLENVLTFALEMLAPYNACSDILSRIPRHVGNQLGKMASVQVGGEEVAVTVEGEAKSVMDQAGRLRLLHTAGYSHTNIGSVLTGLEDQTPAILCHHYQIQGWTKILEFKSDLFRSVEVSWTSSCESLSSPILERLFLALGQSSVTDLSLSLCLGDSDSPSEQLRCAGHLLGLAINSLRALRLSVSDGVNVFPLVESLSQQVKQSTSLTSLSLDMELSSSQLCLITSSLHKSPNLTKLTLTRAASGSQGFKQLQQLLRTGKIKQLDLSSNSSVFDYNTEDVETDNQYVYEDEALISEESKLSKLSPLLAKICRLAGASEKEVSPVEIVSGSLHPCLRYGGVYPAPLCPGHRTAAHYVCQALTSKNGAMEVLGLTFSDPRDLLCIGEALLSNCSLRCLRLRSSTRLADCGDMEPVFPLMVGVSCHLGLTELDLSGVAVSLNSESLQLCLAALSSTTALSLHTLNLSGWTFSCQMTEKTNLMQAVMEVLRTSRISRLNLSNCSLQLSCNQRLFTLYFELEEENRARSLWQEIHDEKISSAALRDLDMAGLSMTINKKEMLPSQELSMLDCPNIERLNLSARPLDVSQPPCRSLHLWELLENLPLSLVSSVRRLELDNYCLQQNIPPSHLQDTRALLASLSQLRELSLANCWFTAAGGGKEEILKCCLEVTPHLLYLHLDRCYVSKQVAVGMSRVIKTRVKRGATIKISVSGCSGDGIQKMMTSINLSKFVVSELDSATRVLTVQRV